MKKILGIFLLVCIAALTVYAANETTLGVSNTVRNTPADVYSFVLHSRNTAATLDTFATTKMKVYGPYPLAKADNGPIAAGFAVMADVITGTTPVASFDYQVISGREMKDTVSSWTSACTLGTSGTNSYFSLASKAGDAIVFRINNYDNSQTEIPGLVKVYLKENATYYRQR